jgi:hypothetical protein
VYFFKKKNIKLPVNVIIKRSIVFIRGIIMEYAGTWLPLMGLFTFILPIGLTIFVLVMLYQMNQSLKRIAESLEKK